MRRFPSMKTGLASILSCLALLLGLYTTTGTASAHSANHPFINVVSGLDRVGNCLSFVLEGGDFTPNHHVALFASASGGANIDPDRVRANGDGRFATDAQACGFGEFFNNCGGFIDNPDFFCGTNLNPEEFCGLPGFSGFQSCFTGSAMKSLDCLPPNAPACSGPPSSSLCPPTLGSSCFGPQQQQQSTPQDQSGLPQNTVTPQNTDMSNGGQSGCHPNQFECCQSNPNLPECSGRPHNDCFQNPQPGCPGFPHNDCFQNPQPGCPGFPHNDCFHNPQPGCPGFPHNDCFHNPQPGCPGFSHNDCFHNPQPGCPGFHHNDCFHNQQPGCPDFHHRFRFHFHPVPVFDFCRFHFHEGFPFCFRFFPREFPITIGITAVDEHTGARAHVLISFGGSF